MIDPRKTPRAKMALFLAAILSAGSCSNGGDSRTAGIDRGGVRVPVAVSGPITGFGSVFVNGIRFDVSGAQIDVNGLTASEQDLQIGQIVSIDGELDTGSGDGVASRLTYEANVRGTISSKDAVTDELTVLGQTILGGNAIVRIDGIESTVDQLQPGDLIEVSGHVDGFGQISATHVQAMDFPDRRVRGVVQNLDVAGQSFSINDLMVDYGSAGVIEGFPQGAPQPGDSVIVVGDLSASTATFVATELRLFENGLGTAGEEIEIEDLITRFVSPTDFDVGGVPVRATQQTEYEGGSPGDLQLSVKVQVEGTVGTDGVVDADKIEIKDGGAIVGG